MPVAEIPAAKIRGAELLGTGGSAHVWRAVDATGRTIALKALRPELRGLPGAAELLQREHALLRELRHEHIVADFGVVEFQGAPALALEYLGGGDLVSLAGGQPRSWIGAARDVLTALLHVHSLGLAHRDVKARNVLFDESNRIRLIDFASAQRFGVVPPAGGTTAEQRRPGRDSPRVSAGEDVVAFAALLYELMSGRLPFGASHAPDGAGHAPGNLPAPLPAHSAGEPTPELRTLGELVLAILSAGAPDSGSLFELADVIESAVARYR